MQRQFVRFLVATAGAIVITAGMLMLLARFSALFSERSGDRIFLINDILPAPERGRPERPPAAARPPERDAPDIGIERTTIAVDGLDDPGSLTVDSAPALPSLEDVDTGPE